MGLRDLFRRRSITASPEVLEALADRRVSQFPALGGTNQQVAAAVVQVQNASYSWIYKTQPAVRTVIDFIARNISQLDLKLYEQVDVNRREERPDHPAAETMDHPNDETPPERFWFEMAVDWCIYDNAYALKLRPDGDGARLLFPLPPARVGIVGRAYFRTDAYRIWRADGTFFDVRPEDMLHIRGTDPDDPRRGHSKLETLRNELTLAAATTTANVEVMKSGLAQPGYIERPLEAPDWSDEARIRFEEDWANRAKQSARRHPVLEEGMTFKESGMSPSDAQMLESREYTVAEVARIFGIPTGLLSLPKPLQLDQQHEQFYNDVLPPITELFAGFLNTAILQDEFFEEGYHFQFDLDEKLQGPERIAAFVSATGAPVMLRNEARARLGLPPVPGGDELVTPLNVLVGDPNKPSPQVMPPQQPGAPPQDGSHRPELPPPSPPEVGASLEEMLLKFLGRQEQSVGKALFRGATPDWSRWDRELESDLTAQLGPAGELWPTKASQINRAIADALSRAKPRVVYAVAKATVEETAAELQRSADEYERQRSRNQLVSPTLRTELDTLRALGAPQEVIWERAGFGPDEIDRWRSLQEADRFLSDASKRDQPQDH